MDKGPLIGRGRTADIYAWGADRVVKLFHDWMPDESIEREARIGAAIHAAGLSVPRADGLIEVDGRRGIVYERVEGPSMLDVLMARPWLGWLCARQMADLHVQMHAIQVDNLPAQRDRLRHAIQHADRLPDHARQPALDALDRLPDGDALCHGDFHPGNIVLTPRGPVIIDWMTASCGDPAGDVARTALLMALGEPPDMSPLKRLLVNRLAAAMNVVYLRRYRARRGLSADPINSWRLPVHAARLYETIPAETDRLLAQINRLLARQDSR